MKKPRVLIVTPFMPFPLNSGGNQAQYSMIDACRGNVDFEMIFPVAIHEQEAFLELKNRWADVRFHPYFVGGQSLLRRLASQWDNMKRRWNVIRAYRDFKIRDNSMLYSAFDRPLDPGFIRHCDSIASQGYDVFQVDFFEYISLVNSLPMSVKKVFVHYEIRTVRLEREMALFDSVSANDQQRFAEVKKFEFGMLSKYDSVVVLSDVDKAYLESEMPGHSIISSPSYIQGERAASFPSSSRRTKLVFLGSPGHAPNFDGLRFFLEQIFPKIQKSSPGTKFHVIGNWKKTLAQLNAALFRDVNFTGFVPDLHAEMSDAIIVVPLRIGSGIRIKIIDAVRMGVPVVTTTIGVEGLDFGHDEECLIADDPDAFAECVLRMIKDGELQNRLRDNANRKLQVMNDLESLTERRMSTYRR